MVEKKGVDLEEDDKNEEVALSPDEAKLMKQLESGKEVEEKLVKEAIQLTDVAKFEWFIKNLYDIDETKGLVWKDYDQISKQRKVVFFLLKQMGANVLKGKSIMSVSMPVTIFEPLTMLQRLANVYIYLPAFAERLQSKDPLEKLKHYIGWSIASLHVSLQQKKPFNPVWGETFEGYIGDPTYRVFCEQTSHHPPISNIFIETPWFTVSAVHKVEARTYPNSIRVKSLGGQRVVFKDEQKTEYIVKINPEVHIGGLVLGKRTVAYENFLTIKDKTNKLYVQARFNPEKQGFFEKIFSKTTARRSDFFKGFITKNKALLKDSSRKAFYSKDMISYFEGQWLEYVLIDGDNYWQLGKDVPAKICSLPGHLPSDSVNRTDLMALVAGNEALSQEKKEELEDIQRKDRKLREPFLKKLKK